MTKNVTISLGKGDHSGTITVTGCACCVREALTAARDAVHAYKRADDASQLQNAPEGQEKPKRKPCGCGDKK